MYWLLWIVGVIFLVVIVLVIWHVRQLARPISAEERARRLPFRTGGFINGRRLEEIIGTASLAIMTEAREKTALTSRQREVKALEAAKKAKEDREKIENP